MAVTAGKEQERLKMEKKLYGRLGVSSLTDIWTRDRIWSRTYFHGNVPEFSGWRYTALTQVRLPETTNILAKQKREKQNNNRHSLAWDTLRYTTREERPNVGGDGVGPCFSHAKNFCSDDRQLTASQSGWFLSHPYKKLKYAIYPEKEPVRNYIKMVEIVIPRWLE